VFRIFLTLNLLFLNLYACKGGFEATQLKVKHSNSIKNNQLQVSVLNNHRLVLSKIKPNSKIIKHDPFLNLYLVEDKKSFKHPFKINMKLSLSTAMVNNTKAIEGKIDKQQVGLNKLASFSSSLLVPSLLANSCSSLEGLVTKKGIIEKEYIKNFLKKKKFSYSDIGVRVEDEKSLIIVKSIDPFMKNNLFKKDDCILELDGKKVKNSAEFMRKILFSTISSKHKIKIKRDSKLINLKVISYPRYGGAAISDTFLEQKAVYFDDNLKVIKILNKSYGLHIGDKLLKVNGKKVNSQQQIRKYISDFDETASLLFDRNNFQFFVQFK